MFTINDKRRSLPLDPLQPARTLGIALSLLRHPPPPEHLQWTPQAVWDWAHAHWQPARLAGLRSVPAPA